MVAAPQPNTYNGGMQALYREGDTDPRSILIVAPTWVGDFVMATPTLRAIRRRFPEARISILAEPNLRELVHGGPWHDDFVEWPEKPVRSPWRRAYRDFAGNLRRRRFDLAVLLPNSFRAALIAWWCRAEKRVGYDRDRRGWLLTHRIPVKNRRGFSSVDFGHREAPHLPVSPSRYIPMPIVEYYGDLAEAIGCARPDHKLELFTTPECDAKVESRLGALGLSSQRPLVVISPGAKFGASKCWATERFAETADRLVLSEGAQIVITCGPGEAPIAREIGRAMAQTSHVLTDPGLTLGELKSLIRRSDLLLCNDAGPRHLAKAFDVPVVTVFGPTHPEWTDTDYAYERIVRVDVDCGPCQQKRCPLGHLDCMNLVTVDMVTAAAIGLMQARSTQPAR